MECIIKLVNSTPKYDFYCCWFGDFTTGTMLKDKAEQLKEFLANKDTIDLSMAKKLAYRNNFDLFWAEPLKRII